MIAGWVIVAIMLSIGIYDLIAKIIGLPTISGEVWRWEHKAAILVTFILGFLAGHLVSF